MKRQNIFEGLPTDLSEEVFENLINSKNVQIDRIISKGHCSPPDFWYEQERNEYVLLLKGRATLRFEESDIVTELLPGDYVDIPAQTRHRVESTEPYVESIWLVVFY